MIQNQNLSQIRSDLQKIADYYQQDQGSNGPAGTNYDQTMTALVVLQNYDQNSASAGETSEEVMHCFQAIMMIPNT